MKKTWVKRFVSWRFKGGVGKHGTKKGKIGS